MSDKKVVSITSLKTLLVPSKSVELDYPGIAGFKVKVNFLSRETLQNLRKKATNTTIKKGALVESMDDDLFLSMYVDAAITDWSGLTMAGLEKLAPVDVSMHAPEDELAYSKENALFLMKASTPFDAWISDVINDLGKFNKAS